MQLPGFQGHTVLVVGDVMLDRYWHGESVRISPEAPVPVVHVTRSEDRPGGAANVALNVVTLGARCILVGVIGDDEAGASLRTRLEAAGVVLDLVVAPGESTITKLRVLGRHQHVVRIDFERPVPASHLAAVETKVRGWLAQTDVLVLEDYDKGTLAAPEPLVDAARAAGVPVLVDPKFKPLARYRGADVVKPNRVEFERLAGGEDFARAEQRARELMREHDVGALVVTRGDAGMTVLERDRPPVHWPARPVEVFDATGAGDTVIATLAAAMAAGEDVAAAAAIANVAAAIAVTRPGTAAVAAAELAGALAEARPGPSGVIEPSGLEAVVAAARLRGERIVFTNGCFDILHAGHVAYLAEARALGDRLLVAINGDDSVRRLKGAGRPINGLAHRAAVLAALAAVDWVTWFDDDTPEALLERVRPDVLVKGGDYTVEQVVGAERVRAWGGEVRVLAHVPEQSSTAIIARARDHGA